MGLMERVRLVPEEEKEVVLDTLVRQTQGFTPADIAWVVRDAVASAYNRSSGSSSSSSSSSSTSPAATTAISLSDLIEAVQRLKPSTLALGPSIAHATTRTTPQPTQFTDLSGVNDAISLLTTAVLVPLKECGAYVATGVKLPTPSGVLLYGPPGTGKTKMVQALASGEE